MGKCHDQRDWQRDYIAVALLSVGVQFGLPYSRLARIFRTSRGAISGAIGRHVRKSFACTYAAKNYTSHQRPPGGRYWTEERLTQRWADRPHHRPGVGP